MAEILQVRLPRRDLVALTRAARAAGLTRSGLVRLALNHALVDVEFLGRLYPSPSSGGDITGGGS